MKLGANITALFGNATGGFSYDSTAKSVSNLRLAVDATSIMSNSSDNKESLSNLLGVSQYPEIQFAALDTVAFTDNKASIKGTLTVHGVSKPVTMDATINNITIPGHGGQSAKAYEAVGLSLHGSFKRIDFGIADDPDTPALFGESVTVDLEMQAIKQ